MMKISIKREQSQAGLSFAEREKFRPQVKNKLFLLLALLLTAATGAWADVKAPSVKPFTVPDTWQSVNEAYTAADLPADFADCSDDEAAAWAAACTDEQAVLIYSLANCYVKSPKGSTKTTYEKMVLYGAKNNGMKIYYTFAASSSAPKHLIKATNRERTRSLEQPLPYATTIGELFEAVTGEPFSDLISTMSSMEMPLTGISSNNTSAVSIGELNGASTPVTVIADGKATISINFGSYAYGIFVSAISPLYATMKDDVKDADKWTVKVGEGQAQALPIGGLKGDGSETVTLQYNGRLKVKGVKATSDAAPAKEPATVTTAPTGAAIVGVGKTTALVSGGVAEGGTMMYKVQATKTKPPTTVGFSADVPTAETITATGTVYVWYYVKGDDTHTDSEIAATPIVVPVADVVWDATNVSGLEIWGTDPYEMDGVKLSGNADNISAGWVDYGDPATSGIVFEPYESGGYTFTAPSGKAFTKIEMKAQGPDGWYGENLGTGWAYSEDGDNEIYTVTWTGSAASTDKLLPDTDDFSGAAPVKCIAFYLSE